MAAETMKITAKDLHHLNVIDSVIDEPLGGAHNNIEQQAIDIKQSIRRSIRTTSTTKCR